MISRRDFLKRSSLIALAPAVPAFLARAARAAGPRRDGRVLVVIQLDGGNDGINTVVPFKDEGYAKHRKALRLPADRLVKLNDGLGLHPSLGDFGKLFEAGQLAVVQGVGYPNPNRSHFESMAVWHTARLDPEGRGDTGWLGRALDAARRPADGTPASLFVGADAPPAALRGRKVAASALARLEDFLLAPDDPRPAFGGAGEGDDVTAFVRRGVLDAYATAGRMAEVARAGGAPLRHPTTALAERLGLVARLLKAGSGARIFYTAQGGYDTHGGQEGVHPGLLADLSGAVKEFLDELAAARLADRVAVLCFSEFGRRVEENASAGTDHGTAGPVFLAGPEVKGGLFGRTPRLLDLEDGDLKMGIDFRRVYATVLEDWLSLPGEAALGARFDKLPLFGAG
ncbi:MAG TPA: DUF1501 domain-containing protein [Gemmataceae bacterium]|nr:DUF1501 domain-containing protein [Gemmataceae bacterium]